MLVIVCLLVTVCWNGLVTVVWVTVCVLLWGCGGCGGYGRRWCRVDDGEKVRRV